VTEASVNDGTQCLCCPKNLSIVCIDVMFIYLDVKMPLLNCFHDKNVFLYVLRIMPSGHQLCHRERYDVVKLIFGVV